MRPPLQRGRCQWVSITWYSWLQHGQVKGDPLLSLLLVTAFSRCQGVGSDSTSARSHQALHCMVLLLMLTALMGHAIVQSRGGTDNIEKTFGKSRGDNRAATAQGTDGSLANNQGSFLMKIVTTKGNTGSVKVIDPNEIDDMIVKKRRIT